MKTTILTIIFCFGTCLLFAQKNYPLKDRVKISDVVLEGKILSKHAFWDEERKLIYTANIVEVYKIFKGNLGNSQIEILTFGGEIDGKGQYHSDEIKFGEGNEGIFFCKYHEIDKKNQLMPCHLPISYNFDKVNFPITDTHNKYENLENEVYMPIEMGCKSQRVSIAKNTWEKQYERWLALGNQVNTNGGDGPEVFYSFENVHYSGASNQFLEVDIYARSSFNGIEYGDGVLYIEYNPQTFGSNMATNGQVSLSSGTITTSADYTLSITDETAQKLKINIDALQNPTNLTVIGTVKENLCHLQIDITNLSQIAAVSFDSLLMQGLSTYYVTGSYFPFEVVHPSPPIINTVNGGLPGYGIIYTFENLSVSSSAPHIASFDVYAAADGAISTPLSYSSIYFTYNPLAFGYNVNTNGAVNVYYGADLDMQVYNANYGDHNATTLLLYFEPITANSGTGLYMLTATPAHLFHVEVQITTCDETAGLAFEPNLMANQSLFYNGIAPVPYESYIPLIATDSENPVLCSADSLPVVTSIDGQLHKGGVRDDDAGIADILVIHGNHFGNVKGKIYFRNANSPIILSYKQCDTIDIFSWSDTLINMHVPSASFNADSPMATGAIAVVDALGNIGGFSNANNPSNIVMVKYSILNLPHNPTTNPTKRRINLIDKNGLGGYTFQVSQELASKSADVIPIISASIEQWKCGFPMPTHVNFNVSPTPVYIAPNPPLSITSDGVNSIFLSDNGFSTPTIAAKIFASYNYSLAYSYGGTREIDFFNEIDIYVRRDLSVVDPVNHPTLDWYWGLNPLNAPSSLLDFYTVILHELGHAGGLEHVLDSNKVMTTQTFFTDGLGNGFLRILHPYDQEAGVDVMNHNPIALPPLGNPNAGLYFPMVPVTCTNSVESPIERFNFSVYPNPTHNYFSVEINVKQSENFSISLINTIGQTVLNKPFGKLTQGIYKENIFSHYSAGIYYLVVKSNNHYLSQKLIIE